MIFVLKVNETANQIEKAFVQRVMEKDWLDQTTKNRCAEKVHISWFCCKFAKESI